MRKRTDFFPAVVFMGPPHSGKSVLAYLLRQRLLTANLAHFLLRTAPDGEGDWFYEGPSTTVKILRYQAKGRYTRGLPRRMFQIIQRRPLPLLVDIGGRPQGEQWDILEACTHGILLYRSPDERARWLAKAQRAGLEILAVLESRLDAQDQILATEPYLQGVISGLERHHPRPGVAFEALWERLASLFTFSEEDLERIHRQQAPYMMLSVRTLGQALGKTQRIWWLPEDLPEVVRQLPQEPIALYGRGPVWLAAAIAAAKADQPFAIFDVHFGWLQDLSVTEESKANPLGIHWEPLALSDSWYVVTLHLREPFFDYGPVPLPHLIHEPRGVIVSGKLPRWVYAALSRHYARNGIDFAVWEPRMQAAIGVTPDILGRIIRLRVEM